MALPIYESTKEPPLEPHIWPPEDEHPWTPSEEKRLRVVVEANKMYTPLPWQTIALTLNAGHNSGSCKAKYESLKDLLWPNENNLTFLGAAGNGAVVVNPSRTF